MVSKFLAVRKGPAVSFLVLVPSGHVGCIQLGTCLGEEAWGQGRLPQA